MIPLFSSEDPMFQQNLFNFIRKMRGEGYELILYGTKSIHHRIHKQIYQLKKSANSDLSALYLPTHSIENEESIDYIGTIGIKAVSPAL